MRRFIRWMPTSRNTKRWQLRMEKSLNWVQNDKFSIDIALMNTLMQKGKEVYPALTDAHGHIFSYARMKLSVNVFGVKNMQELIVKADKYNQKNNYGFVLGWGWDQTLFPDAKMPTNNELNKKFPSMPVALWRVDGHAMLLNQKALEVCGINENTTVKGGQVLVENGKCTGVVLDGAVNKVLEKWQDFPKRN